LLRVIIKDMSTGVVHNIPGTPAAMTFFIVIPSAVVKLTSCIRIIGFITDPSWKILISDVGIIRVLFKTRVASLGGLSGKSFKNLLLDKESRC